MTEEEKAAYEKRRADELYENMLRRNELSKKRAADVVLDIIVYYKINCMTVSQPFLGTLAKI